MKSPSPGFVKALMGLDYSPKEFQKRRRKNQWSDSYGDHGDQAPRQVTLDKNNSALGWQLPQRQVWNSGWGQDADQSGYCSEDSEFNSISLTLVTASEANTAREEQNREQEGTFDCCLNQKIMLSKLNDDPVLMTFGYGWLMLTDMLILGVQWMPLRTILTGVSQMDFGECGSIRTACWETAS